MSAPKFEVTPSGGVRAIDVLTGRVLAERAAVGTSVVQLLPLGAGRVVVRENYFRFPRGESNVYCLDAALREVWRAELPAPSDVYANPVAADGGLLRVASWECWSCELEPASGRIVRKEFTK
jgi:hypothetical protein